MTQPGAAGVITRRTDSPHTRRGELRSDRGVARARYDSARRIADRFAFADRQPAVLADADRPGDPDGDGLRASTGVGIPARIPVGIRLAIADRIAERLRIGQPARCIDARRVGNPDRESDPDAQRIGGASQG